MAFRRGAMFVREPREHSTPLDRNQRARLLFIAEGLDRATKAKGRRNGCLGYVGLLVLRCLLLRFHNAKTGLCCPGYDALQEATGLCRGSIASALHRLADAGLLRIVRRLAKVSVGGMLRCQQATNIYSFNIPAGRIPVPMRRTRERAAVELPRRGMVGEIVAAVCESTLKPGTIIRGLPTRERAARLQVDWRDRARAALPKISETMRG